MNQRQEGLAQFLLPCRNTAELFEVVEEPFHFLASLVQGVLIIDGVGAIAPGWYHRHDVLGKQVLADGIAVIACIHNRMGQRGRWWHLGEHLLKDGTLLRLSCRQANGDAGVFIATANMDVGGETTPRAAQSLCGVAPVFFNAPAAC